MKRWSAMAKAFTRIGKDIVMAVKEGGPNPDANSRLRAGCSLDQSPDRQIRGPHPPEPRYMLPPFEPAKWQDA